MLEQFFFWDTLPANRVVGSYDYGLVALSFIIAALASYVALDMAAQQGREQPRRVALFWHIGGAIAMGAGIWSMHFTGMLAYNMGGMEHGYSVGITLLSLIIPIIFSYIVLHIVKTRRFERATVMLAAPFLGFGIAAMHYTGMAAMEMKAALYYTPGLFLLSLIIAITASAAALELLFKATKSKPGSQISFKLLAAAVMGAAICGMHYTGMHAAVIVPFADCRFDPAFDGRNSMLALGIGMMTLMILGIAIAALTLNQKFLESLKAQVAKQTEELRQAKDLAEAASIAKSEFLANMSHEIRTPMNAVIGIANILQADKMPPEKKKEYLDTLQLSAEALLRLINELLDIAKIEANNVELEYIDFDLKALSEEVIRLLSVRSQEKGITLTLEYNTLQTRFLGDPLRVRQVLVNLVSNAVKFTEQGGVRVVVESSPANDNPRLFDVRIIVADTGIGIAPEKRGTIFQKFNQAESSITRKYGGSGLGLAISKGLVDKMQGRIEVESYPGKGSAFTVVLPLEIPQASDTILASITQPQKKMFTVSANPSEKVRVLLVEDNQANILVTTTYLQDLGIQYDVAYNGKAAIEKYNSARYGLILMDLQMPDMSGYEVTHWIREIETRDHKLHTPIIAMTAFASVETREKCLEAGMDEYIAKPFKPDELGNKIFRFLSPKDRRVGY